MIDIIAFGGWIFWSLIALAGLWLFIAVGRSSPGWALVPSAFIFYLFGWAATGAPWPDFTLLHWFAAAGTYFAIGGLYAVAAWWVIVRRIRAYLDEYPNKDGGDLRYKFKADKYVSIPPQAKEFSSRITGWIAYWPIAFVAYLVGDWLGDIVGSIARALGGIMGRISRGAFEGYDKPK